MTTTSKERAGERLAEMVSVRLEVEKVLHLDDLNDLADELECMGLATRAQEELWVIALDGINQVRTITRVAAGTYHDTFVSIPAVLSPVLLAACDRFVVAHNHPNGKTAPTNDDIDLTARIEAAAKTLDIAFDDHLILAPNGTWVSMRKMGMLRD